MGSIFSFYAPVTGSTCGAEILECSLSQFHSTLHNSSSPQMNTQDVSCETDLSIPNSSTPLREWDYLADWKINRRKWHWFYGLFLNACIWVYWLCHKNIFLFPPSTVCCTS